MDILSLFVIRTALPFGYLIAAIALLGFAVLGLAQIWRGMRARPLQRGRVLAGVILVAAVTLIVAANEAYSAALDFNPLTTTEDLKGEWRDGRAVLLLLPDGRFSCAGGGECDLLGSNGTWLKRNDHELEFRQHPDAAMFRRVVQYRGHLRLTELIDDPDSWDGRLTFELTAPSA